MFQFVSILIIKLRSHFAHYTESIKKTIFSTLYKVFLCQFYVAKMPLKSYKICSKIFEHGFDPPPLLNDAQKNCGFGKGGHP